MSIRKSKMLFAILALAAIVGLVGSQSARADVRLPKVFSDHMVLQRELPIAVFGWAEPGEKVTVSFREQTASAVADKEGRWNATLPALKADSKPHTLSIKGKNAVEFTDVLVGEVWLSCGQSNMSRGLRFVKDRAQKEPMDTPNYRLLHVDLSLVPQRDDVAKVFGWAPATQESMNKVFVHPKAGPYEFSEVTYYFGKRVAEELKVPVGMIAAAMPGSMVQEWTPLDSPETKFDFSKQADQRGKGALYQSMLNGIPPFTIRGAIYYQGENDANNAEYAHDLQTLVEAWRGKFNRPDLPFYMAQIGQTTFMGGMLRVWESEAWVMNHVPHTGLAPSNDLWDGGNPTKVKNDDKLGQPVIAGGDPHPPNKNVIATRLADIALAETYGALKRETYGPMYQSHEVRGDKLIVTMQHVGAGLKTDDGKAPNWFQISADSKDASAKAEFMNAEAKIVGKDKIEIWSEKVKTPRDVRFAWHPLARHNLYNAEGLPAISFHTDVTDKK